VLEHLVAYCLHSLGLTVPLERGHQDHDSIQASCINKGCGLGFMIPIDAACCSDHVEPLDALAMPMAKSHRSSLVTPHGSSHVLVLPAPWHPEDLTRAKLAARSHA
jgi:hypothetical protein